MIRFHRRRSISLTIGKIRMFLMVLPAVLAGAVSAQESAPVKIGIVPEHAVLTAGHHAEIAVVLQDARSRPAGAERELAVDLAIRLPSGSVRKERVVFAPGESKKTLKLALPEPGLVEVTGRQRQLLQGSAPIMVRGAQESSRPGASRSAIEPMVATSPRAGAARLRRFDVQARSVPPSAGATPPGDVAERARAQPRERAAVAPRPEGRSETRSGPEAEAAPGSVAGAAPPPFVISLYLSPGRPVLADGHDAALVDTFVKSPPGGAPEDTKLWLRATGGDMMPIPLLLRAGESHGRIQLTSQKTGDVSVGLEDVEPSARIDGVDEFKLHFAPPITGLRLSASPPTASLFDSVALVVELRDDENHPVATDKPREITLTVGAGQADLDPPDFTIDAGQSSARAWIHPRARGPLTIVASTPELLDQTVEIPVRLLSTWLVFLLIGGMAGGWLAHQRTSPRTWLPWRGLIAGLLAGPALYWLVANIQLPGIPEAAVRSLFGMVIIALIGGYLGTEVFELARKLILGAEKA